MSVRGQQGFSLIETVLALGLLGAVLISIAGLFVYGARQLQSGKMSTTALSVARGVVEEMSGWSFQETWERYGLDGRQPDYWIDSRSNPFAARWQEALDRAVRDGRVELELRSVADAGAPDLVDARAVGIVVTVHWSEGIRARKVRLATVRM